MAASEHGADYLVNSAAKHWNMSPSDPRFPTHPSTLRSQPTHLSTLCSTLIPCACFFARVNCSLKMKLHDFFTARYKNQRTLIETPSGPVLKTITRSFAGTAMPFPSSLNTSITKARASLCCNVRSTRKQQRSRRATVFSINHASFLFSQV